MSLDRLYQFTILEYSNRSDLREDIENPTDVLRGHNPNCGDDISLILKINEKNIIEKASFKGNGCAISTASTAMLVELITGKEIIHAKEITEIFFKLIKGENLLQEDKDKLGEALLLEITKDMPARIKCSTLSWHSLTEILNKY